MVHQCSPWAYCCKCALHTQYFVQAGRASGVQTFQVNTTLPPVRLPTLRCPTTTALPPKGTCRKAQDGLAAAQEQLRTVIAGMSWRAVTPRKLQIARCASKMTISTLCPTHHWPL